MTKGFKDWSRWSNRTESCGLGNPGVYAIAISSADISGIPFSWRPDIVYIGMTNAKSGLRSRLRQFDRTIYGGEGHGGACRVRFKHPRYEKLISELFVAIWSFECDVISNAAGDLRIMGDVAKQEYECIARFVEQFGQLPEFNDKKRSPKK